MLVRLLLAVCLTQFIFAQEQIVKGIVLFEGIPLEGASVIVKDFNVGTITDASGAFSLTLSNIKNPKITISYLGYKSFNLKITKISNDLGNIELVSDDKLDEVVISGTLKPVSRLKSPVSVEVYAESFFKANPTSSIFEALDIINGVRPQLNCNVCSTGDIHINGQEGSYTMILIDGLPIVSGLSSVYGLSGIPQSLIERIEIIKGPASTLYGSEAIGGVINLITKIPENASRFSFDSFTSNWGDLNLDLGHQYRLSKKINGLLGVNYFKYSNPVDNNSDGFTDLTLQDRISVFNKLNIGKRLSFASRFVYEDRWGGEMNWNPTFRGGDLVYGESIYTSRVELFGTYKFNNEISFQFSFNDHNQNSVYGTTLFKADQSIAFGQFIWNRTIKKHDLVIGAAYRFTFYDDNTTATFNEFLGINKEEITQLPGVFIQDEIQFNEQNSLLLGFRYDYNSIHGTIFTPRLNYKISNQDLSSILRISIGSGYRIAQIFTEDHAALTGARDVVFLNDLDPERSWNINLNYVYKMYLKQGHILNFDASIFRTDFSNKILPNYDTDPNLIIFDNLSGKSVTQGISLNFNSVFQNGLRISLGATYIDSYIDSKGLKTIPYLTEKFQGVWNIKYEFQKSNITLDFTGTITGPLKLPLLGDLDPRSQFSPTFNIINLQLTKEWNNSYELYGGVKNILNFTPADNSIARAFDPFDREVKFDTSGAAQVSPGNPYALTFDPSYVYASNQGSRFFIGFRYYLN
jgi:outer membrane receptor for ferrienterochelin and colicins